ncbi:hypothetical protein F7725_006777 [Dissostichus mawsoni]|uniref:Calx-beta domain-containing protein n=1 Tax=Dissostichus mawsoni TaxID=36200 RepID=A0A7J5XUX2_DISMA|nr:hypothetical protein F7725_006777 [Dissostichus mawsoni]
MEGMNIVIDTPVLNGADADIPPEELVFIISKPPKHGAILNQLSTGSVLVTNFTLEQIREASSIIYEHDDSETTEDSFDVTLTDGKYSVQKTAMVMIIAVDDETPRMLINDGLEVEIGEAKEINSKVLKATDLDSDDSTLTFIIRFGPGQGLLQRKIPSGSLENITLGMNFTQAELDAGLILYTHNGQEGIRDLLKFDVTDGMNPLIDRYFYITVGSIDMVFPDVVSKGVSLREGGRVTLTTDLLSTTDLNSPDENLVFTVTRAPVRGHLECTDTPGMPIASFTQLQLAGSKVYYIHTSDDEVKMDSFEFEVTDGFNPIFRTFRVSIVDVDNKKPVVTVNNLVVTEGQIKLITPFELTAEDQDTSEKLLRFTVTQLPVHGKLLYNKSTPVTSFTKQDLNENLISYKHDGTESSEDSFSFTITDGTHTDFYIFPDTVFETRHPQTMKITIVAIDNGVPQMVVNKGAPTLKILSTGHLGFPLSSKVLRSEDRDSTPASLVFHVTTQPKHGYIINLGQGNNSINTFSQGKQTPTSIIKSAMSYGMKKMSHLMSSSSPLRITREYYVVDEEDKFHEVVLRRRGYLGETSFIGERSALFHTTLNNIKGCEYLICFSSVSLFCLSPFNGRSLCFVFTSFLLFFVFSVFCSSNLACSTFLFLFDDYRSLYLSGIGTQDGSAKKDEDFKGKSQRQVQFNPGQTTATWRVRILTDGKYEQAETFQILLSEPVMGVMEFPDTAIVEILDPSDESTVFFPAQIHSVEEDVGELFIPVHRSGDISEELMVVCYTQQGSASGTIPTSVLSYSDFISRPEEHGSVLHFDKGEREKQCRVVVIDDSLYEGEESFNVTLSLPVGGRLGKHYPTSKVNILEDLNDAPVFYFGEVEYHVDESDGYVEVKVWRTGTDLSKTASATVRSRKAEPVSAEAGIDYVGISLNLDFAPGVSMQTFRVTILDDLGQPELEGIESFELVLRMPVNGILGEPGMATVFINDSVSDLPKVQFREPVYSGEESDGQLTATVYRSGDITHRSTVRCYTRQGSAQVASDFDERPNTETSIITFLPGEAEKPCMLSLVDDTLYEEGEEMRLVLGNPKSDSQFGASVGALKETLVKIKDTADKPIILFLETKMSVSEPKEAGTVATVRIPVVRVGDTSKVSVVRVHTKDGSAISGEDYYPVSQVPMMHYTCSTSDLFEIAFPNVYVVCDCPDIEFNQGDKEHVVEVEVLFDGVTKVIVYIEETNSMADVTFPSLPNVVSLLHYDDVARTPDNLHPPAGYPVICVTACNTKYPDYDKTGSICVSEHINNTLTRYRWLISAPAGPDGVTSPMREVDFDTFFTSSKMITLDSVYFQAGSRVQCAARAVNSNGDEGLELSSPIITVSQEEGMCQPRKMGTVGAEPFSAKLRYTGVDDPKHPNLIKVTITMPHIDGMLPVISTRPLMNFELTLSPDGTRVGNHRCSNLLDYNEVTTGHSFITASTRSPESIGDTAPYQFSDSLRGNSTLRFYRNLNLEACLWEFTSYYHMSELLTDCGGTIGTDGQVLNLVQSYVTLRVPLYVSYVFHSPVGTGGWQHFDLQSELRLTFVYDTAILWKDGIGSPPQAELQGALYPTSMRIHEQGRLVVNFRTKARFRGLFVHSHSEGRIQRAATSMSSMVMSVEHPGLTFNLTLVRSEPSYNQPVQQWTFTSDFAVRDYSGTYTVKLIPCTTSQNMEYTLPPVCSPREPVTFDLDIRFQQVSDPVAVEFSLNTQMFLLSKRSLWLSDGSMGFAQETDVAFSEGDTVYGRVMVDPVQNLGDSFFCSIEKVFLCTGADGYVPKYNPTKFEFGCLADSPSLLYRFKIIDKAQPETQARVFGDVSFNAVLAVDDPSAMSLVRQPGSDGFRVDSTAMFQVAAGREWFIHTIYTVRSRENAHRGIGKRSLEYHSLASSSKDLALTPSNGKSHRARRLAGDEVPEITEDIGADNNRGTNIMHIDLDRNKRRAVGSNELFTNGLEPSEMNAQYEEEGVVTVVGVLVGLLLTILIIVTIVLVLRSRQKDGKEGWREEVQEVVKGSVSTEPMLVVRMQDCHNSSEV